MARVIIVPDAKDSRGQARVLIALNRAAGAAVIISQCLHTRKEGVEDGTDEGAVRCTDCGATGKPGTGPSVDHDCTAGSPEGCLGCADDESAPDACNHHPEGCPPHSAACPDPEACITLNCGAGR